jgi:hypothetical protein
MLLNSRLLASPKSLDRAHQQMKSLQLCVVPPLTPLSDRLKLHF